MMKNTKINQLLTRLNRLIEEDEVVPAAGQDVPMSDVDKKIKATGDHLKVDFFSPEMKPIADTMRQYAANIKNKNNIGGFIKNGLIMYKRLKKLADAGNVLAKKQIEFYFMAPDSEFSEALDFFLSNPKALKQLGITQIQDVENPDDLINLNEKYNKEINNPIHIIAQAENYIVLQPLTYSASRYYGALARWCVSYSENYWDKYTKAAKSDLAFFRIMNPDTYQTETAPTKVFMSATDKNFAVNIPKEMDNPLAKSILYECRDGADKTVFSKRVFSLFEPKILNEKSLKDKAFYERIKQTFDEKAPYITTDMVQEGEGPVTFDEAISKALIDTAVTSSNVLLSFDPKFNKISETLYYREENTIVKAGKNQFIVQDNEETISAFFGTFDDYYSAKMYKNKAIRLAMALYLNFDEDTLKILPPLFGGSTLVLDYTSKTFGDVVHGIMTKRDAHKEAISQHLVASEEENLYRVKHQNIEDIVNQVKQSTAVDWSKIKVMYVVSTIERPLQISYNTAEVILNSIIKEATGAEGAIYFFKNTDFDAYPLIYMSNIRNSFLNEGRARADEERSLVIHLFKDEEPSEDNILKDEERFADYDELSMIQL